MSMIAYNYCTQWWAFSLTCRCTNKCKSIHSVSLVVTSNYKSQSKDNLPVHADTYTYLDSEDQYEDHLRTGYQGDKHISINLTRKQPLLEGPSPGASSPMRLVPSCLV